VLHPCGEVEDFVILLAEFLQTSSWLGDNDLVEKKDGFCKVIIEPIRNGMLL
jgi:hypothetical protein